MSKEKDAFIANLSEQVDYNPADIGVRTGEIAARFYENLHNGNIKIHATTTMIMYIRQVLPELTVTQTTELIATMHCIVETILMYLVEDGLIKEE